MSRTKVANRLTNAIRLFIYYQAFGDYLGRNRSQTMERILALALLESLHKRLSYLRGDVILRLSDHIRRRGMSAPAVTNAARRQTIPAFRERGVWKIGESENRHGQEQRVESRVAESFGHVAAGGPPTACGIGGMSALLRQGAILGGVGMRQGDHRSAPASCSAAVCSAATCSTDGW